MQPLRSQRMVLALLLAGVTGAMLSDASRAAAPPPNCQAFNLDGTASTPLRPVSLPPQQSCTTRMSNGFPLPDPSCTSGAVNPALTTDVLRDPDFRTRCVRGHATIEEDKATTYEWYGQN